MGYYFIIGDNGELLHSAIWSYRETANGYRVKMKFKYVYGRYMLPHSELMLHEPLISNLVSGNSSTIQTISEGLLKIRRQLNEILAKHTGKSVEEVAKASGYDHFFSTQECIDFGLCDEIVGFEKLMEGAL